MSENKHSRMLRAPVKEKGVTAIEFSAVAFTFFLLFFGIVEIARAMYLFNTLQEVTRRAAALAVNADFSKATVMQQVREKAIFRDSPGLLLLGDPVSDQNVKIDYLQIPANSSVPVSIAGTLPSSPEENRVNCALNLNAPNCIRLVRVRICLPGGGSDACDAVPYKTLVSLVPFSFGLPTATTIAPVETLGMPPGLPCNC